jgi:glycosyltransferase involved in cell wall biosynthesis
LRSDDISVTALQRSEGFRPRLGARIAECAARHGARVVHCHHYSPFVYGALARLWSPGLRLVFTEHGRLSDTPPSRKRRVANRLLSHAPHRVVTVSADLKEHLAGEGFARDRISVIYNGIDVGSRPGCESRRRMRGTLGLDREGIVVGTVARLDPVKDLGTLVRAVAATPAGIRPTLLVIGDGSERTRLETLAHETGVAHAIRFLGHRDDARDVLAACDLYANSSISEGISLTILEAMAAGLPVVATHVGGTPEILDNTCGRLVPARDPQSLAAGIRTLASDPGLRRALGDAGRARVEERFTLDRMVREYRDAYFAVA